MGLEELIRTLRENEKKQIAEIWQAAEKEAESLRQQVADAIADISRKHTDQLTAACQKSMHAIYADTEMKTREKKLMAYNALSLSLQNTAEKLLPALRRHNYETIFAELVDELPGLQWQKVAVNPVDRQLAEQYFAPGQVAPDPDICGGLIATAAAGKIIVNNTFAKRLERKWMFMLPAILAEIEKQYDASRTAQDIG